MVRSLDSETLTDIDWENGCPIEFQDGAANRIQGVLRQIPDSSRLLFQRSDAHLVAGSAAAKAIGFAQKALLEQCLQDSRVEVELFFHPLHEAGGDFLGHYDFGTDDAAVVLTDVSGHDLQSAVMSAFFHGLVRGALAQSAPVSTALEHCNRYLVNSPDSEVSIAATSLLFNSSTRTLKVTACGSPPPMYIDARGAARRLGGASSPLGWFEPLQAVEAELT